MTAPVCLTVDVEDWYDGMAELGEHLPRPPGARSGLSGLAACLDRSPAAPAVTLFVVGKYAETLGSELEELAERGHEVASHGPDHGHLPEDPAQLLDWLRRGRTVLEDRLGRPVRGFRSPRFDVPATLSLAHYRELLAEAGFEYVSDTRRLGATSPVRELPVLARFGYPFGGGSYQRLLPAAVTRSVVGSAPGPVVLYYHSYDFGATLPPTASIRSVAVAKQLVGRGRVATLFTTMLDRFGSEACGHAGA
jgi:peptidoglycan/xylan/chitin deacetylase (PgdA/CDA1 family)